MNVYQQLGQVICPKRQCRRMCAEAFGVEEHRLVAASRVREIVIPRHATFYVLRKRFPSMSLPSIGRFMGGRDHSTILHGIRRIEERMEHDEPLRLLVHSLVRGRTPVAQDAHVVTWLLHRRAQSGADAIRARVVVRHVVAKDSELAEFVDPDRVFCDQCDRAVTLAEGLSCAAKRCGLKVAS